MIEWCYVELLVQEAADSAEAFESLYREAQARCAKVGWSFPTIHPKQEALLEVVVELGIKPIVLEIIGLIKGRKPISRPVRARLKEIEAMYAG